MMRHYIMPLLFCCSIVSAVSAQEKEAVTARVEEGKKQEKVIKKPKILFGTASYYADKFNGRKTASGEAYDHKVPTAACNVLPLGTWIRVTNIKNKKSIIVKINDRLHPKMKRIVDLSRSSAERLGYTRSGLTEVKVEVIGMVKPKDGATDSGINIF